MKTVKLRISRGERRVTNVHVTLRPDLETEAVDVEFTFGDEDIYDLIDDLKDLLQTGDTVTLEADDAVRA